MPYQFKKGGIVKETGANEIPLPLSKDNLKTLIEEIVEGKSKYTSQDFANWCRKHHDNIWVNEIPFEKAGIDECTFEVLRDVDSNWDLYLVNNYKHEELQKLDLSKVNFPRDYLNSWLNQLR
jgi:hypothetical protein